MSRTRPTFLVKRTGTIPERATNAVSRLVESMRRLPAHPEVPDALARLQASGLRMVAVTNSVLDVARE